MDIDNMWFQQDGAMCHTPHVIGIHIIHFRPQEVAYHRSVALAVNGYGNAFILEKVRTDDFARPKSANSDFLGMHLELVYLAWIGIPNSIILLVHISIHPKMAFIAKDDLFGEIWVNFQLLQNPISEHTALWFTLSSNGLL